MSRSAGAALCILVASAAAIVALAGEAGQDESRPGRAEPLRPAALRPLMPAGARPFRERGRALRVSIPPGWQHTARNVTPRMADPVPILTIATSRPRVDPRGACGPPPDLPQLRIGPRDALLLVTEELGAQPDRLPKRPRRFALARSPLRWPCLNRRGVVGLRNWFRAHGRLVELTAIAGGRTSRRLRRTLLGVIESLRFAPPAPVAVRALPRSGGPQTRFRLELTATHRTGRRGRRERDYRASVRGPQRIACVIENEAWFSDGPPGTRLGAVLDPSRTKGQRWCRGRFRGVVRYRDALCRRDGSCWRTYSRTAGHFHFTVR